MNEILSYPKISIITAVLNRVQVLEQCIQSIVNQTYNNIEYIIIDGGSTDGTLDLIKKYENKISYWKSEPDNGLYDAFNKGIKAATGDYIYFIGSDDCLYNYDVIEKVSGYLSKDKNIDILCGRVYIIQKYKKIIQKLCGNVLNIDEVCSGKMAPHQGMFVESSMMKKNLFREDYIIAGDFNFFLQANLRGFKVRYISNIIAFFEEGGMSSTPKLIYDYERVLIDNNISMKYIENLKKRNKKNIIREFAKFIMVKVGYMEKYKINFRGFEIHKCELKQCRWCKNRAN